MSNTLELRGLTVIVTGASSGIGAATARALHDAGARPVLAARRTERLETLSAQLGGALCVQTDVTDAGQVADLVAATLERHGRIDALVNNAGASLHDTTIEQLDLGEFHQVLDLNLVSVIRLMQAVLPSMRRQGFGRIVNISSG
ncbi:MAG: short-chain dehydrogenase/reductase, partial [Sphaerisporangium sp.]|nr:short-chain dehydrogenase/reductase [Sphaerisporangium sp.]